MISKAYFFYKENKISYIQPLDVLAVDFWDEILQLHFQFFTLTEHNHSHSLSKKVFLTLSFFRFLRCPVWPDRVGFKSSWWQNF